MSVEMGGAHDENADDIGSLDGVMVYDAGAPNNKPMQTDGASRRR